MESSKENNVTGKQPFDFKIKALKRELKAAGMPKKQLNQTVAIYKKKVYTKVAEVKAKMQAEYDEKQTIMKGVTEDATDK